MEHEKVTVTETKETKVTVATEETAAEKTATEEKPELYVEFQGKIVTKVVNKTKCLFKEEEAIQRGLVVWNAFSDLLRESYEDEEVFAKRAIQKVTETLKYCFYADADIDVEKLNVTIKKDVKILAHEVPPDLENTRRIVWAREIEKGLIRITLTIDNVAGYSWAMMVLDIDAKDNAATIRIQGYRMLFEMWPIWSVFYEKDWSKEDDRVMNEEWNKLFDDP